MLDIQSRPFVWIYEGRNNGWWYYDFEMQDLLEEAWNAGELAIKTTTMSTSLTLVIDMRTMLQNGSNGSVRAIRRIATATTSASTSSSDILIKGIAGRPVGQDLID